MSILSTPEDEYDRMLAEGHLSSTRDHLKRAHERGNMYYADGRPWCKVLRPCLLPRAAYERACSAARVVAQAVGEVTERMLSDRDLRAEVGFPEYLESIIEIDGEFGNQTLLARLDGFLQGGDVVFVEYNAEAGGIASSREIAQAFASAPIATEFRRTHPYESFDLVALAIDALHEDLRKRDRGAAPALAVLKVSSSMVQSAKLRWLPSAAARGCRVFVVTPEEIERRDGKLFVEDVPIDLLVVVDWSQVWAPNEAMRRVLESVATGAVRTLNGVSRVVMSTSKVLFEVLTSPAYRHFFSADMQATLLRHVPWTRWIRDCKTDYRGKNVDPLPFVAERREHFVLKPSNGKGGEGFLMGCECDGDTWREALRSALSRPHVVQERVLSSKVAYPCVGDDGSLVTEELTLDLNPFVWNGERAEGALIRASAQSNLSAGTGSVIPLWILD